MSNVAEQRIQDVLSIASDIGNEDDLIVTLNDKLIAPFFDAFFTLDDSDMWLKEQGLLSLIRLMKTHIIDEDTPIDTDEIKFYKYFIPYIDTIYTAVTKEITGETEYQKLRQNYFMQLWCEVVGLVVHSHQKEIIEEFFKRGILTEVVKKMKWEVYKTSTVLLKSTSRIIIELMAMKFHEYVQKILDETKMMEYIVEMYTKKDKEFFCFASEMMYWLLNCENETLKEYPQKAGFNAEEKKTVDLYHEEMSKILMEGGPEVDMSSEEIIDFDDDDDEDDSDSDSDDSDDDDSDDMLDTDIIAEMEEFFNKVKPQQDEMIEDIMRDSGIPDMKDDPLMPRDLPVFSRKYEHVYDEVNRQDSLFV